MKKNGYDTSRFRWPDGKSFRIDKAPTKVKDLYADDKDYETRIAALRERINDLQKKMYAHNRYAVLAVFQAMDAAGKDSTITHVFTGVSPTSVVVHDFKSPSTIELEHDYLWRSIITLPERGKIGVFNRSYYEEVLICKVHPEIITKYQRLPEHSTKDMKKLYRHRYESIRTFESHLHWNGTRVIKFFLNVSKKEQARRFLARIDDPSKNWKFNEADLAERDHWAKYMEAYQAAIRETATNDAPWYVIPADDKKNMRLLVASAMLEEMQKLHLSWPELPKEQKAALARSRATLAKQV